MSNPKKQVYNGCFVDVFVQDVTFANGNTHPHEYVVHPGAVAIVPILDDEHVIMIRNYRFVVDQVLWELPAGIIEEGETPEITAKRELLEETGYSAEKWDPLMQFYTSPGFCDEKIHVYIARNLVLHEQRLEEGEEISVEILTWREILELLRTGAIVDCKTISALLYYRTYYRS